ncbi:hypothetical protein MMC31_005975, partial [Peltigera leucophlebia]|nr:hypothetical protein [Peltigera leucophlebia]
MVPWLDKFSKESQPGRSAILKFFTNLEITDYLQCMQSNKLWPVENLDLSVLQKLTLRSAGVDYFFFSTLNNLFADG